MLVGDISYHIDQDLEHARANLQVPIYIQVDRECAVDPNLLLARYMAYTICSYIYKNWRANMKWLEIPRRVMLQLFEQGHRHDALGKWRPDLSEMDPETLLSRDVLDEEVLAYGRSKNLFEDPDGEFLLIKLRTNQLISKLMRGAAQLGIGRDRFNPANHLRADQTLSAPQMHSSCYALLQKVIGNWVQQLYYDAPQHKYDHGPCTLH